MITEFISVVADFSMLIPIIVLIIRKTNVRHTANKLVVSYILLLFIRNIVTFCMTQFGIYNIYLYNWHNLISFILIAILYYTILQNRYFKLFALISVFASIVIIFLDYQSLFDIKTVDFNRFSYNVAGCIAIILIMMYFYELIQSLQIPKLNTYPLFWFSAGALFYYSGTIFPYVFINSTFNNLEARDRYWMIDSSLSIIFSLFLGLALWYMKPAEIAE
jgi:hypothetical protein